MRRSITWSAAVVLSVMSVVGLVSASSTISTNISTGGTLSVTGASTLTGNVTSAGVLLSSGDFQASSTAGFGGVTSFYGNIVIDKAATTTVTYNQAGINYDANTFVIDPNSNRIGIGTSSPGTTLGINGTTTMTGGLTVGLTGNPMNTILMGTCTYNPGGAIVATTTLSTNCTGATGVRSGDKVFVTPRSLENNLVMTSASSTATSDVIQVSVFNPGAQGSVTPASATWSWMAIR